MSATSDPGTPSAPGEHAEGSGSDAQLESLDVVADAHPSGFDTDHGGIPQVPGDAPEGEHTISYESAGLDHVGDPLGAHHAGPEDAALEQAIETIRAEVRASRARADGAVARALAERLRVSRLDGAVREAGSEREKLQGEVDRLRESDAELKTLRAVIDVLRNERDDLKGERDKLRGERDLARQAIDEGAVEFESIQKRVEELESQVSAAKETAAKLDAAVSGRAKAETQAKELASALEKSNAARQAADKEAQEAKKRASDAEATLAAREKDLRALLAASITKKGAEKLLGHAAKASWLEALLKKAAQDPALPPGGMFGGGFQ